MQNIKIPLKIIWVGEHAVCYEKKAIGQTLPELTLDLDFEGDYRTDNPDFVVTFIEEFFARCQQNLANFSRIQLPEFKVTCKAPFGVGLGTSAALAVALAQLVMSQFKQISTYKLTELIEQMESFAHGKPSGIDQYLVCQIDGIHAFQNGEGRVLSKGFPYPFVILNSGGESRTGQMVKQVADMWDSKRNKVFNLMRQIGHTTYNFLKSIRESYYDAVYDCLIKNQDQLYDLGVVTEDVHNFCKRLRAFKIAGKVTGAGGIAGGSGAIIVCYKTIDQYNQVRQLAEQFGFDLVYKANGSKYGYI